jgi:EmrB/QacA subfamily drug resistance transporter
VRLEAVIDPTSRRIALLVAGCFFMENLDTTIVATSAPQLAASLRTTTTATGLVLTAYLMALAVFIPLSGWLTARFGARRILLTAITVFTLASLGCAVSTGLGELVATRAVQGLGGAMMVPVGRLIVVARTAKPDIPRLMSYVVWPGLVAPVVAPLLGGLLTTYASWRWMFLINVPLGVVAFAVAWRLVRVQERADELPRLDWSGLLLVGLGLGGLTYTAHLISDAAGSWPEIGLFGAGSLVLLAAAVWHLRRAEDPLIDLSTLRVASFRSSALGGSLHWMVVAAVPFVLPLLFQEVFGWSAVHSGAVVLFVFVGNIGIKPATTFLINRFGPRALLIGATLLMAATMLACTGWTAGTPLAVIAAVTLLSGVARSVGLTGYSTIAFADLHGAALRHANTLSAAAQQTAMGLGVAMAAVGLRLGAIVTGSADGAVSIAAYRVDFALLAGLALLAAAEAIALRRGTGDVIRGARPAAAGSPPATADSPARRATADSPAQRATADSPAQRATADSPAGRATAESPACRTGR